MTNKEAKEKLYMEWQKFLEDNIDYAGISEAYKMAFKALDQEPCEDAISRILKRMWNCRGKHTTSIDKVKMEQIIRDELPPVNPQEPKTNNDLGVDCIVDVLGSYTDLDIPYKREIAENILTKLSSVTPQEPKIVPIAEIKFDDDMLHEIVEEAVKNIEIEPKWITVGERLPQKDESVLLTICANSSLYGFNENYVKVMCGSYSPCEDKRDWVVNEIRYYIDNVIAWMPLPEPYKAESEVSNANNN